MKLAGPAALFLVLTACGGQVGKTHHEAASATGGAVAEAADGGGEAMAGPSGGSVGGAADGGQPGAVASGGTKGGDAAAIALGSAGAQEPQAGAAAVEAPSLIESDARYCESDRYCFGLSCYAPPGFAQHVCVDSCRRDADCGAHEVCLTSADLDPGCYRVCQTPFDCEYGFDCFDFANTQRTLVCFPTPWARAWGAHHP